MVTVPQVSLAVGASKDQALLHSTVLLGTQVMVGGVRSSTVTVWLQSAVLPQASVARQVRVASKVLPRSAERRVGMERMVLDALPHVSMEVGAFKDQPPVHWSVMVVAEVMQRGEWHSTL